MGTVGDCYDNAPMESFWGSMQIELLNRQRWRTKMELGLAMADYIEHFYNSDRRHSSLGYLTPNEFEDLHLTTTQQATLSSKVVHPMGSSALGADDGIRSATLTLAN